jgi:2-(1,2-epoxy-1,2-dihydrophenyl)acetyl-CoA isomerase
MSEATRDLDGIEVAKRLYQALAERDGPALKALLASQARLDAAPGMPGDLGGRYEGSHAIRHEFWGRLHTLFDATAEVEELQSLADGRVVALGTYRGVARGSGLPVEAGFAHVLTIAAGQILQLTQVTDTRRWQEAIGQGDRTVGVDVADGIATITLQRAEAHNAINLTFVEDLLEAVTRCTEPDVRAVLVRADGSRFTVGGDVTYMARFEGAMLGVEMRRLTDRYHLALRHLTEMDAPVVAAVQGPAAGGGLGIVLAADLVVAAASSRFALGYTALGLTADGGTSWFLPRIAGLRLAQRMFLRNEQLDADTALQAGLISEVVPDEQVLARATEVAAELAAGPTRAFGAVKRLLVSAPSASLSDHLDAEQRSLADAAATDDAREGITAFVERRIPRFQGR